MGESGTTPLSEYGAVGNALLQKLNQFIKSNQIS